MNILIGAHGVGKTTLLDEVRKEMKHLYITDGVSRPVKKWLRENVQDSNLRLEQSLINTLTEWNWIQNLNNPIYTSTRSVIDSIIYSKCLGFPDLSESSLNIFINNQSREVKYFYIPIEFELKSDGIRFTDREFQHTIDREIKSFITAFKIPVIEIKGSLQERVNLITTYLRQN